MNTIKKLTVCGVDKRYITVYRLFSSDGFDCKYITDSPLSEAKNTDMLILPIPSFDREGSLYFTDITVYDLFSSLKSGTLIFAGKTPSIIKRIAEEYKMRLYDYTDNEEFNILNAVSTAEGAILTILERTHNTILGSKFTILGYGRIGRALAVRLKALGGNVAVGARSSSARATASSDGITSLSVENAIEKGGGTVVINTVPAPIINNRNINNIKGSLIIDLASIPGGLTDDAKAIAGENFIHALSLPGKHFPETAGRTIYKTIKSILQQAGDTL